MGLGQPTKEVPTRKELEANESDLLWEYPYINEIHHPARILILGRSLSGKTTLAVKLVQWLLGEVDCIIICSPTFEAQTTWEPISPFVDKLFDETNGGAEAATHYVYIQAKKSQFSKRILLIFDDVSWDPKMNTGSMGPLARLAFNAMHMNISLICVSHRTATITNSVRESADFLFLFNAQSDNEITDLSKTFTIPGTKKEFVSLFNTHVKRPIEDKTNTHPFLFINYRNGLSVYENMKRPINISSH